MMRPLLAFRELWVRALSEVRVIESASNLARELKNKSRSPIVILVAGGVWILLSFHGYLPVLFPADSFEFLRRTGTYDVLLALWFTGVAYCAGKRLLRLIGVTVAVGVEETVFSIATGAMAFSLIAMILSFLHGLYRPVAFALLIVPTALWQAEMRRLPGIFWHTVRSRMKSVSWNARSAGQIFLVVYVAASLGFVLISALGPSYEYDDLVYHLTGPKNFVQAHKFVPLPDVPLVFLPKNIEMLHTLALLWHTDILAKLLVFLCGLVTMVGIYGFSARFLPRGTGMIAVAVLASSPLFLWEMRTAHNDLGLTLFVFAGFYTTVLWLQTGEVPFFRLACLFLAFSLGAKYWAVLALGITVFLVLVVRLRQSRALRPAVGAALKLGLYSSLGLLPWCLVNLYYTGNPVFPLLNGYFHSPYWTSTHTRLVVGEMFQGGIRISFSNWWDLFRLPWEMMVDPHGRFGGNIGPWYVIFIPFLLFIRNIGPGLGFLFAASALYYVGWAVSGPWVRFLLPALPGLAAGSAFAIGSLLRHLASFGRNLATGAGVVLALFALLASPFFEAQGSWSRYGNPPLETFPIRYLTGQESKSDFLGRFYSGYRAVEYLNRIPGAKKVLYVHTLPDGFYLNGKAAFHYSPYVPALFKADAAQIHDVLRQNGITHVVVEQPDSESSPLSSRESEFTHRYLRKLFQGNTSIVYELLPGSVDQSVVAYDFLEHLIDTDAGRKQPGTPGSAYREVRRLGEDRRYVMVTIPPSEAEFLVDIPDHASLTFATAREDVGYRGKGSFQVWISPPDGIRRMIYSRDLESEVTGWIDNRVDLTKYAGRGMTVVLKTEDPSPSSPYFWADPVVIAPRGAARSKEAQEELHREVQPELVVSGGQATPAIVRIGRPYEMKFTGTALTSEMYFDITYLAPQKSTVQEAFNWQHGASSRHTIAPSITPGTWLITGVRAHRHPKDHEGGYNPVRIILEVAR